MGKYRVKFHPIVLDVYAQDERGAMDAAWEAIDNFQWDEYNLDGIENVDDSDEFYPINWVPCAHCGAPDPIVRDGLCKDCFHVLIPNEWHDALS